MFLFFIQIAIINLVNAQTVHIPDTNFKTYLVGNSAINTNGDTEIQLSEAGAFTGTIDCGNLNITNLTGIEAFVNLTKLWCYNNQLTSLNISQNTALIDLRCDENWLTKLDVSKNTALKILMCHINQLTVLDVSKNTTLKDLRCYENQLANLDVSSNVALERLDCALNFLVNLDISQNTILKELTCGWNQLKKLNLKNGNNAELQVMLAKGNPNLSCIQVDNVANSNAYSNWAKDAIASYNTDCNYMSVNESNKTKITLYPNPVKDILNFSEEVSDVKITDISGKTVKQVANSSKNINVENLPKGIYIVSFKTKSGNVVSQKLIKD